MLIYDSELTAMILRLLAINAQRHCFLTSLYKENNMVKPFVEKTVKTKKTHFELLEKGHVRITNSSQPICTIPLADLMEAARKLKS